MLVGEFVDELGIVDDVFREEEAGEALFLELLVVPDLHEEPPLEAVVVDVVGDDFLPIAPLGGGADLGADLETAATFDGPEAWHVRQAEAADVLHAVAFVDQGVRDEHFPAGDHDRLVGEGDDFVEIKGDAPVDDEHVAAKVEGELRGFLAVLLEVGDHGQQVRPEGEDVALVGGAELEDVFVFEGFSGFLVFLATASADVAFDFYRIALGLEPLHGEVAKGDEGGVGVPDVHAADVCRCLGIHRDGLVAEEHGGLVPLLDAATARGALEVGSLANFFEVVAIGQVLELRSAEDEVFPLQGLHVAAVGAGEADLFLRPGLEFLGDLVGFPGGAEADDLGVFRALDALAGQIGGGAFAFDVGVLVQLIEDEKHDGLVRPRALRVGPDHVDRGVSQVVGEIRQIVDVLAHGLEEGVVADPLLQAGLGDFPGRVGGVDGVADISRPVDDEPADDDQHCHREAHLGGFPDPELAFAWALYPAHELLHVGRHRGRPELACHFLVLGRRDPQRPLRPLPDLLVRLRSIDTRQHAHHPGAHNGIVHPHRNTSSLNRKNSRSISFSHRSSVSGTIGMPVTSQKVRYIPRIPRSIGPFTS